MATRSERTDVREGEGVGQFRTQHGRWGRKHSEADQEITAFEPEKLLVWRHLAERLDGKAAPKFAASTEFRIELEQSEEETTVRLRSLQEPVSPLKGWVMKRLGTKDIARNLDISLVRLASAVANKCPAPEIRHLIRRPSLLLAALPVRRISGAGH